MIIWLNGAFGAGKTSLATELLARRPGWILFDPEFLGFALREYVSPPTGDFQDLPEWRHVVSETAISLVRNRMTTLVVPMTLVDGGYRREIFERLRHAGIPLVHYFLDVSTDELRSRIQRQVLHPDDPAVDEASRSWRLAQVDRCAAAASHLDCASDRLPFAGRTVGDLADFVLHQTDQTG